MSNEEISPLNIMQEWLIKEKKLGSINPDFVVLATASEGGPAHSRIVSIREITPNGILFFTQKLTKKVAEIQQNPQASMTLWLAQQQRQVILDGSVIPLTHQENEKFWNRMPRDRQLRFTAYAPTSAQPIESAAVLDHKFTELTAKYADSAIPMSEHYRGFHLIVDTLYFYTLGIDNFSEVFQYKLKNGEWIKQLLSP